MDRRPHSRTAVYIVDMDLSGLGKSLLVMAVALALVGGLLMLLGKGALPRLPGDVWFGKGNVRLFVPIGTSIVVSIVLTILLNVFVRK